ncbi:hypothetical protein DL764_003670 [Monosporascus ibericus]|uniref:Uncharacterized protein n=1 Tax=Monosporascus ibericus TaxID=155417 RepID=A0A4Q4TFR4_9PEZI|nr:hypothetical protein DL764_003670 [Monosporascus ibericus]
MAPVRTRRRVGGPRKPTSPTGQLKRVPNRAETRAIRDAKAAREKRKQQAQRERSTTNNNFPPPSEKNVSRIAPNGIEELPPVDDVVLVLRGVGALDRVQLAREVLKEIRRAAQYSARDDGGGRVCRLYANPEGTALLESVAYPRGVTAGRPELAVRSAGVLIPGRPGRPVYEAPATTAYLWEDSGEENGEVQDEGFIDHTPEHVLDTPERDEEEEEEYPWPGFGRISGSEANKLNKRECEDGEGEGREGEELVEVDSGASDGDVEWLMMMEQPTGDREEQQQQQQQKTTKTEEYANPQVQPESEGEAEGEELVEVGSGASDEDLGWPMTMNNATGEQEQQQQTMTKRDYAKVQTDSEAEGEEGGEQPVSPPPTPSKKPTATAKKTKDRKKPPPPLRTDHREEQPGPFSPFGPAVAAPHSPVNVAANAYLQSAGLTPVEVDDSEVRGPAGSSATMPNKESTKKDTQFAGIGTGTTGLTMNPDTVGIHWFEGFLDNGSSA